MDVAGVDKDMAGIVAARALQEVLSAVQITIPTDEMTTILESADAISTAQN